MPRRSRRGRRPSAGIEAAATVNGRLADRLDDPDGAQRGAGGVLRTDRVRDRRARVEARCPVGERHGGRRRGARASRLGPASAGRAARSDRRLDRPPTQRPAAPAFPEAHGRDRRARRIRPRPVRSGGSAPARPPSASRRERRDTWSRATRRHRPRTAVTRSRPSARPAARAPAKVSPAPTASTAATVGANTTTVPVRGDERVRPHDRASRRSLAAPRSSGGARRGAARARPATSSSRRRRREGSYVRGAPAGQLEELAALGITMSAKREDPAVEPGRRRGVQDRGRAGLAGGAKRGDRGRRRDLVARRGRRRPGRRRDGRAPRRRARRRHRVRLRRDRDQVLACASTRIRATPVAADGRGACVVDPFALERRPRLFAERVVARRRRRTTPPPRAGRQRAAWFAALATVVVARTWRPSPSRRAPGSRCDRGDEIDVDGADDEDTAAHRIATQPVTNSPPSTEMMLPLIQSESVALSVTIASATSCGRRHPAVRIAGQGDVDHPLVLGDLAEGRRVGDAGPDRVRPRRPPPCRANSIASWRTCDSRAAFAPDTTPYDGTTRLVPSDVIA